MQNNLILIIDFGSQVTQLIARRIREIGVYSIIKNANISKKEIEEINPRAIILSGSPHSVLTANSPKLSSDIDLYKLGVPIFGICYGQQLICHMLGGRVENSDKREYGKGFLEITKDSPLFTGYSQNNKEQQVWMSHGDRVISIPDGFEVIGITENAPFAAIANEEKKIYGVQFHPEVIHSINGDKLIENFVCNIAGCIKDWTAKHYIENAVAKIKEQVGDNKVICGLSGGVDSSVTAMLIHKAIGDNLTCIFVDHGLLRGNETSQVKEMFTRHRHINVIYKDASDLFLGKLEGVSDPETKRKIIGSTFIDMFDEEAKKIKDAKFLAQGTLYPDVIESTHPAGGTSSTIKSHHNVGGLPARMNLKLVEPLRELFKDEVRRVGLELGMDKEMIGRHPFPGPGLAIRIPGEITREKIAILQKADRIYIEEIRKAGLYDDIWQAFAVLLPVKTVGVMGDERTYEYVCALRAVTSTDGMTADYYHFSHDFLSKVSNRIINETKGINRIVYDITSKPPGTIEWE